VPSVQLRADCTGAGAAHAVHRRFGRPSRAGAGGGEPGEDLMRDVLRTARAGSFLLSLPVVAAVAGCKPIKEGGYDAQVSRTPAYQTQLAEATNPPPPPVVAGMGAGGAEPKLVARNLPAGVTQAMVDQGQQAFGTVCAACHGPGGKGTASAPALNDNQWIWITGQYPEIVARIKEGVPQPKQHPAPMPPRGGGSFTDEQVNQIAAYVYALSHQGGA
jgi:mono/diheme cytochrome c family protein